MESQRENQKNVSLARRLYEEVFNKGNLQVCDEIISDRVILNDLAAKRFGSGLKGFKEAEATYKRAFPDKKVEVDDIIGAGDKVIVRWTCSGTQKGNLEDVPASNKKFTISGISIYKFENGKISEAWQMWDRLGLLEQIGEVHPAHALH